MSVRTIYAVNSGSYSDYRVVALFSTREKADEYMRAVPDGDYNVVEEYELDPPTADLLRRGYSVWHVLMLRDGTVERVDRRDPDLYNIIDADSASIWERSKAPAYRGKGTPDVLSADTWAKSEKQAVKAANEKRLMIIASGEWPEPSRSASPDRTTSGERSDA